MTEIIESRAEITPAWLTDTLRGNGIEATVVGVDVEPIIAGYFGCSSRLTLSYEENDESLPRSLCLKMATEHREARERAAEGGMYRYEVGFYRDLAGQVNISTPHCYASEISGDHATFVLLLEDAAPLKQADQLQGVSLSQSQLAIQELAGLHASTWRGKSMAACDWSELDESVTHGYAEWMVQLTPVFLENFGSDLTDTEVEILRRLVEKAHAYWRYTHECVNRASVHADFRADNMLFGERQGKPAMVTIDWVATQSCAGRDLGHFLGTSLLPDTRAAHEKDLLALYHGTLLAQGVTGFSLQECVDDYHRNLLYPVHVVVSASAAVDIDARGREMFLCMFKRACSAIADNNALALIESL